MQQIVYFKHDYLLATNNCLYFYRIQFKSKKTTDNLKSPRLQIRLVRKMESSQIGNVKMIKFDRTKGKSIICTVLLDKSMMIYTFDWKRKIFGAIRIPLRALRYSYFIQPIIKFSFTKRPYVIYSDTKSVFINNFSNKE